MISLSRHIEIHFDVRIGMFEIRTTYEGEHTYNNVMDEFDELTVQEREWERRNFEGKWCSLFVEYKGHKIPCDLELEHHGRCTADLRSIEVHLRGGLNICKLHGCGEEEK